MIFSYNWLKDYLKGRTPEPKKLAELLTRHSFEVREVKKIGGDVVLDMFVGTGATCEAAWLLGRNYIGVDLGKEYIDFAKKRLGLIKEMKGKAKPWDLVRKTPNKWFSNEDESVKKMKQTKLAY